MNLKRAKGKISILINLTAMGLAFINPKLSLGLYAALALIWVIPDIRIEHVLLKKEDRDFFNKSREIRK